MKKLKVMQLPFIILLLLLLAILFFQYQEVTGENASLRLKIAESFIDSENNVASINLISDNCLEASHNDATHKEKRANNKVEKYLKGIEQLAIDEIKSPKIDQITEVIPFENQEIDYEWATVMETAVNDAFQTSQLLEKFTLEYVECRSSICEVRMPKVQEDTFHQSVLVLFALDELGIKHKTLKMSPDSEDGTVIFYFSKH